MLKPLRVMHVLEATLGGTRQYLHNVIDAGVPAEHSLVYATARADVAFPAVLEAARVAKWATWHLDMRRSIEPAHDLACARRLWSLIARWRPDIVHCHSSKAGGIGRIASMLQPSRPRIVYSPHAIAANLGSTYALIEKLLAPLVRRYVAVSDSERTEISNLRLADPANIDVAPPSIDMNHFAPRSKDEARGRLGYGPWPLVVAIGRLTPQKNPLDFVELLRDMRTAVPDVRGIWVGDGELREQFESAVAAASLQGAVSIAGWIADPRDYIAAADMIVSVSQYESFGYVVPEALAMERPVIASRVTGITDIMTGALEEQLFEAGSIPQASRLACRLLHDGSRGPEIAAFGRRHVGEQFSLTALRNALAATYRRATEAA